MKDHVKVSSGSSEFSDGLGRDKLLAPEPETYLVRGQLLWTGVAGPRSAGLLGRKAGLRTTEHKTWDLLCLVPVLTVSPVFTCFS